MSNSPGRYVISPSFDIDNYIEATSDASKRTRANTIVLVVASVLLFIGWYNSLLWSWPIDRVRRAFDPQDMSIYKGLDIKNRPLLNPELPKDGEQLVGYINKEGLSPADMYRLQMQWAVARGYVENVRFVRVPFFGIAFDVNDLGMIGGIGLITILLLMRYSLSREIKNLKISFREAAQHDQLAHFYHALAMRQVFTVPRMKNENVNRTLAMAPKFICILPAIVFSLVVVYDYFTVFSSWPLFTFREVVLQLTVEAIWFVLIWLLSVKCWERHSHIDGIWNSNWKRINSLKSSIVLLDEDLVEEFGDDVTVNRALRSGQLRMLQP
jgi:hypothetical protein